MVAFFILLLLVVQIGMATVVRTTAAASIDGAARRVAMAPDRAADLEDRLSEELRSSIPGIDLSAVVIEQRGDLVSVSASFRWHPPGPDVFPIDMRVQRTRTMVVPP